MLLSLHKQCGKFKNFLFGGIQSIVLKKCSGSCSICIWFMFKKLWVFPRCCHAILQNVVSSVVGKRIPTWSGCSSQLSPGRTMPLNLIYRPRTVNRVRWKLLRPVLGARERTRNNYWAHTKCITKQLEGEVAAPQRAKSRKLHKTQKWPNLWRGA